MLCTHPFSSRAVCLFMGHSALRVSLLSLLLQKGRREAQGFVSLDDVRRGGRPEVSQSNPAGASGLREVQPRLPGRRHQVTNKPVAVGGVDRVCCCENCKCFFWPRAAVVFGLVFAVGTAVFLN